MKDYLPHVLVFAAVVVLLATLGLQMFFPGAVDTRLIFSPTGLSVGGLAFSWFALLEFQHLRAPDCPRETRTAALFRFPFFLVVALGFYAASVMMFLGIRIGH